MNQEKNVVYLMMKDIDPVIYDKLKNFYFDLIIPRGLGHIDKINIIAGPMIKRNPGTKIIKSIKDEDFEDLNFLVHLANNNPDKISFFLRNLNVKPYPHEFVSHSNDASACVVYDADSTQGAVVVFDNPYLIKNLDNIFIAELPKTREINFSLVPDKRIVLKRMVLPAVQ